MHLRQPAVSIVSQSLLHTNTQYTFVSMFPCHHRTTPRPTRAHAAPTAAAAGGQLEFSCFWVSLRELMSGFF